jgi:NOL1/NOP2/fmu family ribosome biogenesis protein
MRKKGSPLRLELQDKPNPSDKELADFNEFCKAYLNIKITSPLIIHGSSLMAVPSGLPDLRGIRVMRSGQYLGELKKNRFEPSQAFAMTLKKEDAKLTIDFGIDDEGLKQYLRGDSFPVECADGWALVCVCGYPLGWGKVQKGRLKNKYLPSWMN